ncbi:ATP-dependent helicase [Novispirillum sp. DQ9]|uniref:ATP-dependent helicase n=1 Tax=Novispirillum sp. DQ9 TaxID=3398612 RepID=UPI003C7DE0CF
MIDDPFDLSDEPPFQPAPAAPAAPPPPWLEGLNPEQKAAVTTTEGPLLVLSGAGTGKTRVLTTRLAHILYQRLAPPWNVLAVTFTNRAAKEMRERIGAMIGPVADQVWLGTFHALGLRMLRKHCDVVGLRSGFSILDTDDQNRVLKGLMEDRSIDTKKWPPNAVMGAIQRWKDKGLGPAEVPPHDIGDLAGGKALELYAAYQKRLLEVNACDFGDLLLHCLTLFKAQPEILEQYQRQFRYILVDEYQDTNVSQYLWLRLLARKHKNICCVGDDDQSIYSWRGAEVGNILRFEKDFPGANIVRLETNYRSTPVILGAASGLIRHNTDRLGKDLRAGGALAHEDADKITVYGVWDGEAEARWVVDTLESLQRGGARLSNVAILVRAGFQTREFEERLITTGTPYRIVGGLRFYERLEVRDALAYLRLISQPDDDLAFERIINTPKRGLGDASVQVLHMASRAQGIGLLAAARTVLDTDELKPKARGALRGFVEAIDRWASLRAAMPPGELVATVLDESGYMAMWKADKAPEAPGRVENLQELVAALEEYDDLQDFLEHIALVMENEARAGVEDAVTLMTLHAAKGLEFDHVFLPGWEEEVFPNRRALDEGGMKALEEERRLAYVGLTRARRKAFITHAANRRVFNQWQSTLKSRFIEEIPASFKEEDGEIGMSAGSQGFSESWSTWGGGWGGGGKATGQGTGWERRKAREEAAGPGWQVDKRQAKSGFARGDRVFHTKFGYGDVVAVEDDKVQIAFDKAGHKKVMAGFVKRADEV